MHDPKKNILAPLMHCIGIIHDLLLPTFLLYIESTMGDQKIFKEYGYDAIEKIPKVVKDVSLAIDLSKNGIVPKANPTGMP